MTVRNVDHELLAAKRDLASAFKREIGNTLALASGNGVEPEDIAVDLSVDSEVRAVIAIPSDTSASAVMSSLGASPNNQREASNHSNASVARLVSSGLATLHGIRSVLVGPLSVENLRVLDRMPPEGAPAVLWLGLQRDRLARYVPTAWLQHLLHRLPRYVPPPWLQHLLDRLPRKGPLAAGAPWSWLAALALGACLCCSLCCLCAKRRPASPDCSQFSQFNGTWVRKHSGRIAQHAGIIVIINGRVHWQRGRESRILKMPEEGYQIISPASPDEACDVEMVDGALVVDGHVFTRHSGPSGQEGASPP